MGVAGMGGVNQIGGGGGVIYLVRHMGVGRCRNSFITLNFYKSSQLLWGFAPPPLHPPLPPNTLLLHYWIPNRGLQNVASQVEICAILKWFMRKLGPSFM